MSPNEKQTNKKVKNDTNNLRTLINNFPHLRVEPLKLLDTWMLKVLLIYRIQNMISSYFRKDK